MMRSLHVGIGIIALLFTLIPATISATAVQSEGGRTTVTYSIESIFCIGCVAGLKAVVGEIDGVVSVEFDIEEHQLQVVFEDDRTDAESLQARITEETTFELLVLSTGEVATR